MFRCSSSKLYVANSGFCVYYLGFVFGFFKVRNSKDFNKLIQKFQYHNYLPENSLYGLY